MNKFTRTIKNNSFKKGMKALYQKLAVIKVSERKSDIETIQRDWEMVGMDMKAALGQYERRNFGNSAR